MKRALTTALFAAALALAAPASRAQAWPDAPPDLVQATATIFTFGQPPAKSLEGLRAQGFEAVVHLAPPTVQDAVRDESRIVGGQGLVFVNIPIAFDKPSCISARARDFARLGRLFLDAGRWHGRQLVPAQWAERRAVAGIRTDDGYLHHQLWWEPPGSAGDFYAYGHNGQFLYVNPAARVVIVKSSETPRQEPVPMFRAIAASVGVPAHLAQIRRLEADPLAARSSMAHFEVIQAP
jgi:hypothetical protein